MKGLDLSSWRIALNGAEPIDPRTVESFSAAAAPFGFDPRAVFCAFGMAEVGIGATFPPVGRGLRTDRVDRVVLEEKGVAEPAEADAASSRRLPMLGFPVPGLEVRVCDASGDDLPDRRVGEVELRGTSVTPGYYKRPDATEAVFHDGWLRTGDLGYLVDGELVLCGRIKDVIIVGGRNVFPEDIERALAEVDGVRAGNVIAFGIEAHGKEGVVVVAESKADDLPSLRKTVAARVREAVGLPPKDVVLVAPGSLPKTSSGKLQRSLCKLRYLGAELQGA
jgi:fatty-acyl-CoA synthase